MEMLTILQLLEIAGVYSAMTLLLPSLLLYQKVKHLKFSARFLIYLVTGNFYLMNLVFILQLLHISNQVTLVFATFVPFGFVVYRQHRVRIRQLAEGGFKTLQRLAGGQLGLRTFFRRSIGALRRLLGRAVRAVCRRLGRNAWDCILVLGLTALLLWLYGSNALHTYGYSMSDIPVHNYWINYMSKNQIFVAGVYPFGFHCIIYYLHAVFAIDTYVLLRLFFVLQTWLIHMVLLAFIRLCCKTKYASYAGVVIYVMLGVFHPDTYSRYYSSLPQEFGMIFILPAIFFALAFFQRKKKELQDANESKSARWYLVFFAMSFSMTLAVHFYDTMIAGLFCIGIAAAYLFRFLKKEYFIRIMAAGFAALFIAILPMGIAYASGTPLQGSLGWGMNVIKGTEETETTETETETGNGNSTESESATEYGNGTESEGTTEYGNGTEGESATGYGNGTESESATEYGNGTGSESATENGDNTEGGSETDYQNGAKNGETGVNGTSGQGNIAENGTGNSSADYFQLIESFKQKLSAAAENLKTSMLSAANQMEQAVINYVTYPGKTIYGLAIFGSIGMLALLSVIFYIRRQTDYAAGMFATAVFFCLMSVMQAADMLGIPALMDASRTSIFYAYMLPVVWGLCLDGILFLLFGGVKKKWVIQQLSQLALGLTAVLLVWKGTLKVPHYPEGLESNAAVTCLTNIISDTADETWTICSANDELRMGEDHGYHYETIAFLNRMEKAGASGEIWIPTHYVYFFIEKIPIDYTQTYEGSGQSVSAKGAGEALPVYSGLDMYKGENRWIVMSRMYEWAKAFQKLYPKEMQVYYETDDFVCYRVEQNDYSLYNFAIDYGYNTTDAQE